MTRAGANALAVLCAGSVVALVGAGPVVALQPAACAFVVEDPAPGERPGAPGGDGAGFWYRKEAARPVDLGSGWVAQGNRISSEVGTQVNTVVTHCPSGANVLVVEQALSAEGRVTFDAGVRAVPAFREAIGAAETITLDAIVRRLEQAGANVGRDQESRGHEACGCAAFYPGERGGKVSWQQWSGR